MGRDIKIRTLIIFSTAILLANMLLMGGLAIFYTTAISGDTETLYNRPHTNLVKMWQTKAQVMSVGQSLREAAISGRVTGAEAAEISQVNELLRQIEANKVDPSAPTSDNMKAILSAVDAWGKGATDLSNYLAANRAGAADAQRLEEYTGLEQDLLNKLNTIIDTAAENALKFKDNSMSQAARSTMFLVALFVLCLVISIVVLLTVLRRISSPMSILLETADRLAGGDLGVEIPYHSKNEFGALADRFRYMQESLKNIIYDIDRMLDGMGKGDFTIQCGAAYMGDFASIQDSLGHITRHLSSVLGEIDVSAQEVSSGAGEVANGAQSLAQGATEQASAVEELAATIEAITGRIEDTAQHTLDAREKMRLAEEQTEASKKEMDSMMGAMAEISQRASEIGKIIKTIEDIAFQTNILALNAAVEAARAGNAGKGFAVVADEVRNLAGKSAEAAKSTNDLISGTVASVTSGTAIADRAAMALTGVVTMALEIGEIVDRISETSSSEAEAAKQVSIGIDQIASVVHNNSATAEQSAAASEELSGQAQMLKAVVSKFKLLNKGENAVAFSGDRHSQRDDSQPQSMGAGKY